jgi:CBS domain-containing protein
MPKRCGLCIRGKVGRIMSTEIVTCAPQASVDEAVDLMSQYEVRRMLVVDDAKELLGVVAMADIARYASGEQAEQVVRNTSQ